MAAPTIGHTPDNGPTAAVPTRDEITAAEQENDGRLLALSQQYGVVFDGSALVAVKFDHLVTILFGGIDDERRRKFDWSLVLRMRDLVAETEVNVRAEIERQQSQARQAQLLQGVPGVRVPTRIEMPR